jgi:hypothetical protein
MVGALAMAFVVITPASPQLGSKQCGSGSVSAVINGKRQCLKPGKKCSSRYERAYAKYGFRCHRSELWRDAWAPLVVRPLHLPTVGANGACPRTPAHQVSPSFSLALDDGTAPYPVGFGDGLVTYSRNVLHQGWLFQKTIWITPVTFRGRVLVRGGRLGEKARLKFSAGEPPRLASHELRLSFRGREFSGGWQQALGPRYTLVPSPGCYALQVDGTGFSKVLVFEAKLRAE